MLSPSHSTDVIFAPVSPVSPFSPLRVILPSTNVAVEASSKVKTILSPSKAAETITAPVSPLSPFKSIFALRRTNDTASSLVKRISLLSHATEAITEPVSPFSPVSPFNSDRAIKFAQSPPSSRHWICVAVTCNSIANPLAPVSPLSVSFASVMVIVASSSRVKTRSFPDHSAFTMQDPLIITSVSSPR